MSRRRRRLERKTNWIGPIVVAVLMAGIAYAVGDTALRPKLTETEAGNASSTDEIATPATTKLEVGVRVPKADRDQLYAVDLVSGVSEAVEVAKGWRVESLNESSPLKLLPSEERGVTLTDGGEWSVVLRAPTGEAYAEPRVLGLFDERHAAILGRTDRVKVLNVSRAGQVDVIADVPETASILGFSGGAAWYSTFTPGEGIESEPSGPSRLFRVTQNGGAEEVAEGEKVIVGIVSDGNRHAYWDDEGFTALADGRSFSGEGRPLAWLETGELVVAKGVALLLYRDGMPETLPAAFSAAPVAAREAR